MVFGGRALNASRIDRKLQREMGEDVANAARWPPVGGKGCGGGIRGGIAYGEATYRLASEILDNQGKGKDRFFQELAAFGVDPIRGFNRAVSGRWGKDRLRPTCAGEVVYATAHDDKSVPRRETGGLWRIRPSDESEVGVRIVEVVGFHEEPPADPPVATIQQPLSETPGTIIGPTLSKTVRVDE